MVKISPQALNFAGTKKKKLYQDLEGDTTNNDIIGA
jgi:hypothetical protein